MDTRAARVTLAAIGYQESKYLTRVQYGGGPAHGYWQFESGGGVKGVMNHKASAELARKVCHARGGCCTGRRSQATCRRAVADESATMRLHRRQRSALPDRKSTRLNSSH